MQQLVESAGEAYQQAADMTDLTEVISTLMAVDAGRETRVRLGGNLFDVVISSSGLQARGVVALMDEIQGGSGPVIEDPESGWFYWLVQPGSSSRWKPHSHAVCLGGPHTITLPSLNRAAPPGPYWLRPLAQVSNRLVALGPLSEALAQIRPEPTPHAALAAQLGIAF
ncbi:hypothetical protein HUT05_44920 [Streptomyces chartreusis]|uniref:Uncharacterized protein n=2 Tax=Streptomyces chartreusis TaxID=1969 RepID=A0A7H8TP80_STRCX|nr:hypothetical protein HUT05_44920 [Streptomyces chartreusis]